MCLVLAAFVMPLRAEKVGTEDAEALTRGWLAGNRSHLAPKMTGKVKSSESHGSFHVVNLEPEGYVITSADDEMEPVVAFSAKGQFDSDPENPLWILLNKDLPERADHLRKVRERHKGGAPLVSASLQNDSDATTLQHARQSKARWEHFKQQGQTPVLVTALASNPMSTTAAGGSAETNGVASPRLAHIRDIRFEDGQLKISHDSTRSVSIQVSYDAGALWQTLDSGIFQSEWVSRKGFFLARRRVNLENFPG